MAPGERCEVIIDFSGYAPGAELTAQEHGQGAVPERRRGGSADGRADHAVQGGAARPVPTSSVIPAVLTTVNRLSNPSVTRVMTLNELQVRAAALPSARC